MAIGVKAPDKTYTLQEFVESGVNDDMTYINFAILDEINGVRVIDHNLIDDYLDELKSASEWINGLTQAEKIHYRYSPDLMSFDVYGTTQLDFVIMAVNGIGTPKDFTMFGKLFLPKHSVLKNIMTKIYNAERHYIRINRSEFPIKYPFY